ncbi:peroxidase family protein [Sphingomonas sp. CARO-RG-8B-R24-01]|uniref:peroxidase family protein n=1 Tax=Sphingomonas sp. CARO-RG-8B-R24-01 TaxID=2914831 RepID=UPI001F59A689|nr:peroxidase family protein [Sphingomonas sp. CARO-RG-8B-R24-01]
MTLRTFSFNLSDIEFLLAQINFRPLFTKNANGVLVVVINWTGDSAVYDANGTLIVDPTNGGQHVPTPTEISANLALYGASYSGYVDIAGLRYVTGNYNNLLPGQQFWGAANQPFTRQSAADFNHYLKQVLGAVSTSTSQSAVASDGPLTSHTTTVPVGNGTVTVTYNTLDHSVVATTTTTTDGHHLVVSTNTLSQTLTVQTMISDASGTHAAGAPVTTPLAPSSYLSGGELDPTYHPGLAAKITAAQTVGTTTGLDMASYNPGKSVVDYTPRMISETVTTGGHVTYDAKGHYLSGDGVVLMHDAKGHVVYYSGQTSAQLQAFQYDASKTIDTRGLVVGAAIVDTSVPLQPGQPDGSGGVTPNGDANLYSGAGYGTLATVGQHDKQNTDANNITGFGNHEYFYGNIASIGGNAPNNQFLALFGQFFDHGLDFIGKAAVDGQGHSVNITIPLAVNDPLYGVIGNDGRPTTSITITRATVDNTWLKDTAGNVLDGHDPAHSVVDANGVAVKDANGLALSRAGADGVWGTADDIASLGGATQNSTVGAVLAPQNPTYINHSSPYIDQSQTYGSASDVTQILREWVADPNHPGQYVAGAKLLDGHQTVSYTNAFGAATTATLPTLNELRAAVTATGRTALTWDDVTDALRHRDAQGHVGYYDSTGTEVAYLDGQTVNGTTVIGGQLHWVDPTKAGPVDLTGLITHSSAEPLLIDINPHVDGAHLTSALALDAIATLNASLAGVGSLAIVNGVVTLTVAAGLPGAGTYTGVAALSPWVNFTDFSITKTLFNAPGAPISDAVHAAVGEVLLDSVGDHYVAGDGRANENFGLTAIHQVWHEEHGFQVQNLEATIASLDAQATASDHLNGTSLNPNHTTVHNWETAVAVTNQTITDSFVSSVKDAKGTGNHFEATGGVLARDTDGNFYAASTTLATAQADTQHHFAGYVMVDNTVSATIQGGVVTNGISAAGNYTDANGLLSWNQDTVFNGAKVTVEMEYQHVAVDQFSRAVSPNIQEFAGVSTARNAAISLEFGQAAYRFGHSTLRETLDTMDPAGGVTGKIMSYALEEAFLNPGKFATVGAGAVVQGAARQLMNEVDQIVTPSLNEGLLAQPLDLGAINIARGRDIGLPTLNAFKAAAGIGQVYTSWAAFQQNMVHPERIADFVAAYSFDGDLAKASTIVDLANLQAGQTLSDSEAAIAATNGWDQLYAHNFMNNIGVGDPADGVNHIDLWIGGLAEVHVAGGLLGETFDAIFVNQIENLMDGDRFYYLQRLVNTSFGNEIQNEQFKDIVERNTGTQHLNGNIFAYADEYYDQGRAAKVATGDLSDPTKAGDLYAGSKSDGSWVKVFDAATHLWSGSTPGVFNSTVVKTGAIYDLWGQQVTDLFDANHVKVFDRTTMAWTNAALADGSKPLYYDANTDANGVASATPTSFVYLGADQHKYGAIIDAHAADTNGLTSDNGLNSVGGHGVGIYSEDAATTALNGNIGRHNVTLAFGDDTTPGSPVISFGENYIYDARPDATTVNKDGSIDGGANSAEVIVGTKFDDFIQMGIGDDTAYGDGGNDIIYGGNANAGHNSIYGGDGNDYLVGGDAPDLIDGGTGDDWIFGESSGSSVNGLDQLIGGAGNDHIFGGIGIDKIFGGVGDDYIYGGQDTDPTVFGGDGNDYINGGTGVDTLNGDNGDDILDGGPGVDQLFGGSGDDILRPGDIADVAGNGGGGDVLIGGDSATNANGTSTDDGFDFADYSQQTGTNGLVGDLANQAAVSQLPRDKTPLPPGITAATTTGDVWFEMEGIIGTKNADHLYGDSPADPSATPVSHGDNWLVGGSGNDVIMGRGGNDVIIGGSIRLDSLIGTYASPSHPTDAYQAANDFSTNAEGASHRIYDDATLQHNGLLDAANAAVVADGFAGVSFEKHLTTLLQSRAYKDYVLGDNGTDGTANIAAYTGAFTDYDIKSVTVTDASGHVISALLVHDHRPVGPTGLLADGITPGDGTDLLVGIQALEFNFNETTGTGTVFNLSTQVFQSPATFSLNENTTLAGTVAAVATLPVSYSIVTGAGAGADAALFTINATTGALSFRTAPNFEAPLAAGGGNIYDVVVQASDAAGATMQDIKVSVVNVDEAATGSLNLSSYSINGAAVTLNATSTVADPDVIGALTLSYQWQSSANGTAWTNIAGRTTASLTTTAAQANQFVRLQVTYTDPFGQHTVASTETAYIGTAGANTTIGTAGTDLVFGLGGTDTLGGGGGDDVFVFSGTTAAVAVNGGAGSDTIKAIADNTVIALSSIANVEAITADGHAGVTIAGTNAADTLDFSTVTLTGITSINGGGGADTITGSAGADVIDGGAGNDTLYGGGGNDTFLIGLNSGVDALYGGAGADTILATANGATIGLGTSFSLAANSIEAISAGAFTGVTIAGTNGTDVYDFSGTTLTGITVISGGGGSDTITGSAGNDTIDGGSGDDTLYGGVGNDTFLIGANSGVDAIFGGIGNDTIVASQNNVVIGLGTSFNLATNGVETISAGAFANVVINGTGNADTYDFTGITLTGIGSINGGAGNDIITGSAGNDTIVGGAGADTLRGGGGSNRFVYNAVSESTGTNTGTNYDFLADFDFAKDKIVLPGAVDVWNTYRPTITSGTLSTATFNANLAAIFNGALQPNSAEFFTPTAGTLAGHTFLVIDGNGIAGYQAGQDWVFEVSHLPTNLTGPLAVDFIV